MKKAALYVRVSTQEQKLHGMSVDNQIEALQQYCESNDYQIAGLYNDAGISGSKSYKKRPALLQMMADCRAGLIDIVLFTRLDRFFRSVKDYYECIGQMGGVPWQAIWEDYETLTAEGKFKVNIMLSVAQSEADKTAARMRDSYQYRKAKGIYVGRVPVGYIRKDGKLYKDPDTQEGVQAMFDTYLSTLSTSRAMSKAAEYGLTFQRACFAKTLKNPVYAGESSNGHKCEPYITPEDHELICQVKHSRKTKLVHEKVVYLFSGLLVCGYCGRRMAGKQRKVTYKNGKTVINTRYVCNGRSDTQNPCIKHLEVSAKKIEGVMLNRLESEIERLQYDMKLSHGEIKEKIKQRRKLENKLTRLKELYVEGDISKDAYNTKKFQLEREIADIVIEQKQIPELPDDWKDVYDSLTPETRQAFWKRIIKSIIITSENKEAPDIILRT